MYKNNLAAAIKVDGKVLREFDDTVYLPFGSEYSIYLKNLQTRRVSVSIKVDGTDAVKGSLIVDPGQSVDLERFVGDSLDTGNKLKFIERTERIESHRGIGALDGLVEITYEFEREDPMFQPLRLMRSPTPLYGTVSSTTLNSSVQASASLSSDTCSMSANCAGITVPGSQSDQRFQTVYGFRGEGRKYSLVFQLKGEAPQEKIAVKQPVTVSQKIECPTCGKKSRTNFSFCPSCGTSLKIYS